jgi:hypothetical protein
VADIYIANPPFKYGMERDYTASFDYKDDDLHRSSDTSLTHESPPLRTTYPQVPVTQRRTILCLAV